MHRRLRIHNRFVPGLLTLTLTSSAVVLTAQSATPPSVTVVSFDGASSRGEGDAMADELAMRLVETRRVRVLQREWLPGAAESSSPDDLRRAAAGAGVDYLVMGSATRSTSAASPLRSTLGFLARSRTPMPMIAPRPDSSVSVHVRVVDVVSGDVVRTAVARGRTSSSPLPLPVLIPGLLLRAPVGAMAAVANARSRTSNLSTGAQHAIADIASTLNLPVATNHTDSHWRIR